jgi:conjugal transfer pilus assembly protein TrbC
LEETIVLSPLAHLSFILGIQVSAVQVSAIQALAEENFVLSQEALKEAIEQATEVQRETTKLLNGKPAKNIGAHDFFAHDFFESQHSQKGCPSQGLKGSGDPVKGCVRNTTPPIPENVLLQGGSIPRENANRILVFVSFSMPEASLKSLAQEAQGISTQRVSNQKHHVVLVMRGLYQNSFVKTASKLQKLGIAVDIHPELFETHHVTSVPTFVQLENGQPIHSLKGNVTLDFVVKMFEEQRIGGCHE